MISQDKAAPAGKKTALAKTVALWTLLLSFDTLAALFFKVGSAPLEDVTGLGEMLGIIFISPWIVSGVACYIGSFGTWMAILRNMPLNLAFALTALAKPLTLICSALFLDDQISLARWAGVGIILFGILLLGEEGA